VHGDALRSPWPGDALRKSAPARVRGSDHRSVSIRQQHGKQSATVTQQTTPAAVAVDASAATGVDPTDSASTSGIRAAAPASAWRRKVRIQQHTIALDPFLPVAATQSQIHPAVAPAPQALPTHRRRGW